MQEKFQISKQLPKILEMMPELNIFQEAYDKVKYLEVLQDSVSHEKFLF